MAIGYVFIFIALACGVTKGYCGKRTSGKVDYSSDALLINTLRMVFCIVIGFFMVAFGGMISQLALDPTVFAICALSGVATASFVVSWLISVRTESYMMIDVCLLIGVIIPMLLCQFLYDEPITLWQWIGFGLLMIAGYVMCTYNSGLKGKMKLGNLLLMALCAASNGFADFSQKMFVKQNSGVDIAVFNFYTYVFAALTLLICFPIFRAKDKRTAEQSEVKLKAPLAIIKPIALYVVIMAICLFLNSYFKTAAAQYLSATQIYPINQGGTLMCAMLMAHFLFKERINLKAVCGIVLCLGALLLINLT